MDVIVAYSNIELILRKLKTLRANCEKDLLMMFGLSQRKWLKLQEVNLLHLEFVKGKQRDTMFQVQGQRNIAN